MNCTVCNHPQLHDIDLAILSKRGTLESLHRQYGVSVSSLQRHKDHVRDKMYQARDRLQSSRQQGCLLKLNSLLDHVQRAVQTAEADGSLDRVIRGSYVGSRIIHQINQMEVSLELETVYRLISAPGFVSQDTLLPTDPLVIADLHQALLDNACAPCPEPAPAVSGADDDDDRVAAAAADLLAEAADLDLAGPLPKTRNPKLDAQHDALRLLQRHYPELDLTTAASAPTAKEPQNQRKITENLPKNAPSFTDNNMHYQAASPGAKNLPQNPATHPSPGQAAAPLPAAEAAASPDLPGDMLATPNQELETFPETANGKLKTAKVLLDLEPALPETANDKRETKGSFLTRLRRRRSQRLEQANAVLALLAKEPENKRDITEKLPKNEPSFTDNNMHYQAASPGEKNLPQNPETHPSPGQAAAPLPGAEANSSSGSPGRHPRNSKPGPRQLLFPKREKSYTNINTVCFRSPLKVSISAPLKAPSSSL